MHCGVQDGGDWSPSDKQVAEQAVAMETVAVAEVTTDQALKPVETEKYSNSDASEVKTSSVKNIMFPSLSDEVLSKIVELRCHGDASKQSR